ncbi:MAG: SpoIVB peptidase S55 domain-containing protein, partial [Planctomycetota bacterium]
MKTPIRLYLFAVLALLCIVITAGKTLFADVKETMDVDEIVPGMKGYGKTVFNGTQIETFHVEVLGVLKNWDVKSNMILIRMSGGPLEQSGIISGMSGSPVYIDNRLIGAVAYGWNFAK